MRDDLADQFLLEFGDVDKFRADAVVFEFVENLADERQPIAIRQPDFEPKNFARQEIFVPFQQTSADADLVQQSLLSFAEFRVANGGNVQRKSDVLSLIYGHEIWIGSGGKS